jgi:hypothetical protein
MVRKVASARVGLRVAGLFFLPRRGSFIGGGHGSISAMIHLAVAPIARRHQARNAPFRLLRTDIPATREGLGQIALVRRQEIDGFLESLFGGDREIDLTERAQRSLKVPSEIRGMLESARGLAVDWTKPASSDDIADTIRNIGKLTTIAEREMHATVLSCARPRRQMLAAMPAPRSVLR